MIFRKRKKKKQKQQEEATVNSIFGLYPAYDL